MALPAPSICSEQLVVDLVAERSRGKNAQFFAGIENEWRKRVRDYVNQAGSPEKVPRWPGVEHKRVSS